MNSAKPSIVVCVVSTHNVGAGCVQLKPTLNSMLRPWSHVEFGHGVPLTLVIAFTKETDTADTRKEPTAGVHPRQTDCQHDQYNPKL